MQAGLCPRVALRRRGPAPRWPHARRRATSRSLPAGALIVSPVSWPWASGHPDRALASSCRVPRRREARPRISSATGMTSPINHADPQTPPAADRIRAELPRVCPSPRLCSQWKTSNKFLALVYIIYQRGGLWLPNQPRPGTAVHRPRPGARLRGIAEAWVLPNAPVPLPNVVAGPDLLVRRMGHAAR